MYSCQQCPQWSEALIPKSFHGDWSQIKDNPLWTGIHFKGAPQVAQFSSVQSLRSVQLFATPWTAARQLLELSIANSQSLLKLTSIESVMPSNVSSSCHPLLLLPSIFPSIRVFSNESVLCIRWSKYWSFSFIISPSNEYSGLISFRTDWFSGRESICQCRRPRLIPGSRPPGGGNGNPLQYSCLENVMDREA